MRASMERAQTANDRLKAQWDARVAWSIMIASTVHATTLAMSPGWTRRPPVPEVMPETHEMEWVFFYETSSPRPGAPRAATPLGVEPDSLPSDVATGTVLSAAEADALAEALRGRILRRAASLPTLAAAEPEGASTDPGQEDGGVSVAADPSTAEYPSAQELSELDLERLSALRPEIAVLSPTNWVLLRNPNQVNDFLRRRSESGELSPVASGSVSAVLWIDEQGTVEWAEIHRSSGRDDLDETTLALLNEVATFWPARVEGVPTPVSMILTVMYPWF